ncbi:hypothetical protein [Mogibacterium diversum]|uniref:hypothetical protein n=1 Tax=Mogibacterium diversum TaxID=114527 RepID=UPI0020554E2E|nr:hypothetical protein [Mogibacterium diversum]MDU5603616.1 hypothetical protein [Mogibacterium sp.]DAN07333.1 MAG TPA: hypothetical protein [Caudoviricetes sp.]DAY29806.1 MAG TPA: hypothetical protein [Caudoviricetes sp.]
MLWNVVSLACLGLLAVITYFVKDLPVYFREMKLEQSRARNSQELLREAYFREIGGEEVAQILKDWLSTLFRFKDDNFEIDDEEDTDEDGEASSVEDLLSRTVLYGSTHTIHLCALYMQDLYEGILDSENDGLDYAGCKSILYSAFIISSLKFDFTGYEVEPLRFLEMKINDLSEIKKTEAFKKALEDIKREDKRM